MELRRELYAGGIKIFKQLGSAIELCDYFVQNILPRNPALNARGATHANTPESERVMLCEMFEADERATSLWKQIITEAKVHDRPKLACWDRVRLRVQQSDGGVDNVHDSLNNTGRFSSTLPIHRDTWASNVMQQLNWWMPLLPIDENRTLKLYPAYFSQPVPNTTHSWSLDELRKHRKLGEAYPQLPEFFPGGMTDEELRQLEEDACPIVIDPGDVLVFSSSHLHGSVVNTCGLTRFSSEVRTVDAADVLNDVGAANVDGFSPGCHLKWFRSIHECEPGVNGGATSTNLTRLVQQHEPNSPKQPE